MNTIGNNTMERNRRKQPQQPQQHYNDNNDSRNGAIPNSSWLDWNTNGFDNGGTTFKPSGIDNNEMLNSSKHRRSKSAPKQRRTQLHNPNDNNYGKLHSPMRRKQSPHGILFPLSRPKSAGKQREITNETHVAGDANDANDRAAMQGKGGGGNRNHSSWASSLLLRKRSKPQHGNGNTTHRLASPSTSSGSNRNMTQTKSRNTSAPTNVCDYCQQVVHNKSRSQMYQRAGYVYCSTICTKFHHQALDADEKKIIAGLGTAVGGRAANIVSGHVPSNSNTISTNTKVGNIKTQPPINNLLIQEEHEQQHHLMNVSYEENTGNQFIPSTAKAAASSTTITSVPQSNAQFPQNWFHHVSNGSDNGDIDIVGDNSTISFGNSWGASGPQPSQESSTQSKIDQSSSIPPIIDNNNNGGTRNRYGRGIIDEYQDYNDELSRQLRLAAKQDELETEERMHRRHQFLTAHHTQQQSPSPSNEFSTRSSDGDGGIWSGGACDFSSPGSRYHAILKNMGVDGLSTPATTMEARSGSRSKYPIVKQNENSTQSTESFSSSSQGFANHDGGMTAYSSSSRGQLDIDSKHELNLSSEDLSNDFSNCHDDGMKFREQSKTPRKGNLSVMFAGVHNEDGNANRDVGDVRHNWERTGIDPSDGNEDDVLSKHNQNHPRKLLKSPPPPSSLYAITEEQSVGPMDVSTSDMGGGDLASLQLLAQKRGLRPIATPPLSSSSTLKRPIENSANNNVNDWADHALEDVVSLVSYYDDPSVDMLSSLATNDTLTTTSQQRAGRRSPPFSRYSSGGTSRSLKPKARTSQNEMFKSPQQQPRSDPPGNSIDEIIKEGVLRHQHGRHSHHNARDASFQGVDPDEDKQIVDEHESQPRQNCMITPHSDIRSEPRQHWQEKRPNASLHPQQGNKHSQSGRGPNANWQWSEKGTTNNEHGREHFGQDGTDEFDFGGIEFPNNELLDGDDTSIGMLTGEEEEDEPPMSNRGDDDTAANTLDTVDLVAEVKRVWRHVQRYETKKHRKKEMKRQLRKNIRGAVDAVDSGNILNDMDDDTMERLRKNDDVMMGQLLQQFSEMQNDSRYHNDGDSKLSDITPFSSSNRVRNSSSRGRASERPPMIPSNGRLGKHIRSTSSHSCTHVEPPDSPGLDSNQAMASRASTEKDAVFLNEGVDEFYEGQAKQNMNVIGSNASPHYGVSSAQNYQTSKIKQLRTQYLNKIQPITPPHQCSRGNNDKADHADNTKALEKHHQNLSTPYDMTKTKSTGTSFTQKTQQTSNQTTLQSSKLRSDMARKYMKQKPHIYNTTTRGASSAVQLPQDRYEHHQPTIQQQPPQQHMQPASPSRLYSKAMQNARTPRAYSSNRIS